MENIEYSDLTVLTANCQRFFTIASKFMDTLIHLSRLGKSWSYVESAAGCNTHKSLILQ